MSIAFHGKVAMVTGAGGGLGRLYALGLAARGARVVVNDLGVAKDGAAGAATGAAETVAAEIRAAGGEAMASTASVTDAAAIADTVSEAVGRWGSLDILVNNAGFLRDKTFAKMSLEDFRSVVDVHLMGAVTCTKAVWDGMRERGYGRVVMVTSSSGLYGNFGQSNYGAAKMALVGLMRTLALEGERSGVRVNALAPTAATRMTESLMPQQALDVLRPERVTPAVLYLASEQAPNGVILAAGAGLYERAYVTLTEGVYLGEGPDTPEQLAARFEAVSERTRERVPLHGAEQTQAEVAAALAQLTPAE